MNPETELAPQATSAEPASPQQQGPPLTVPPDRIPDVSNLVIRDDTPVESFYAEKQYRLLTGPLYDSWTGPGPGRAFLATANVGLFSRVKEPPVVPDVMLSLDVRLQGDPAAKENNTYFLWEFGKPPDVVIEVVSDRRGGEDSTKLRRYEWIAVPYYVIFDPEKHLSQDVLRSFVLTGGIYHPCPDNWFPRVALGVTLWEAPYEDHPSAWWLRWCDREGVLIPTGYERAEQERRRADEAQQRAEEEQRKRERLEALLRQHNIDPNA
jgi:hypothetical protein